MEWLVIYFQKLYKRSCQEIHCTFYTFHRKNIQCNLKLNKSRLNSILSKRHQRIVSSSTPSLRHTLRNHMILRYTMVNTRLRPTKYEVDAFRNLGGRSRRKIGEGGNEGAGEKEGRKRGQEPRKTRIRRRGRVCGGTGRDEQGSHRGETEEERIEQER